MSLQRARTPWRTAEARLDKLRGELLPQRTWPKSGHELRHSSFFAPFQSLLLLMWVRIKKKKIKIKKIKIPIKKKHSQLLGVTGLQRNPRKTKF